MKIHDNAFREKGFFRVRKGLSQKPFFFLSHSNKFRRFMIMSLYNHIYLPQKLLLLASTISLSFPHSLLLSLSLSLSNTHRHTVAANFLCQNLMFNQTRTLILFFSLYVHLLSVSLSSYFMPILSVCPLSQISLFWTHTPTLYYPPLAYSYSVLSMKLTNLRNILTRHVIYCRQLLFVYPSLFNKNCLLGGHLGLWLNW